ncbi:protein MATERNALLY EXPRESSED GENE 3-like [Zea mays]|uniref:protein MATERNALLY EXPRESSED GENE 3-like n=1 Tax=Zea mays TaxID=4577 RepID=UPI001652FEF0|nr:protein MATERNALLY EXPRESSED GENE 3-like [Zea mays]
MCNAIPCVATLDPRVSSVVTLSAHIVTLLTRDVLVDVQIRASFTLVAHTVSCVVRWLAFFAPRWRCVCDHELSTQAGHVTDDVGVSTPAKEGIMQGNGARCIVGFPPCKDNKCYCCIGGRTHARYSTMAECRHACF